MRRHYPIYLGSMVLFLAVLAIGGYTRDWKWTGFHGDTLWDWLHLLVLPVTLSLLPLWLRTHDHSRTGWRAALACGAAAFAVLVIGGYHLGWKWTGFHGNTVWDWLQLLLVPFVLPAALAHVAAGASTAEREVQEHVPEQSIR